MEVDPEYGGLIREDATFLLRPRTGPAGHDDRDRHRVAGRPADRGGRDRADLADLPEREPRRGARLARRRHPRLPEAPARRRREGARRPRRAALGGVPPLRADRPATSPRSRRRARLAPGEPLPGDPRLRLARRGARQARRPAEALRQLLERGARLVRERRRRRSASRCASSPRRSRRRGRRWRAPRSSRNIVGPASRRLTPAAQALAPALRQVRPFFRETVGPIREQIRPATQEIGEPIRLLNTAAKGLADSTPALQLELRGPEHPLQRDRLQPAGRPGRGLPVLDLLAEPQRQPRLDAPGRQRPAPARRS